MHVATILACFFYFFILMSTRSLIDDSEIAYSGSDPETPQDQEYFEHIAHLQ